MSGRRRNQPAANPEAPTRVRCAIYTRKSSEEGLDQEFNSLDAQRESAEAFIASQKTEGWTCVPDRYDDGGFSGGSMERPALDRLIRDIELGKVDCVVVYKVDRLSRSLMDFARIMETFDRKGVSFVSVTQQFNTTSSMGRLTLNILLSFAQFEREIIGERIRDKIAAQKRKGKWAGGVPVLGYEVDRSGPSPRLVVNEVEAARVRQIFQMYLDKGSLLPVVAELSKRESRNKSRVIQTGKRKGILDELPNVKVQRQEIVNGLDCTYCQLVPQLKASLATGHVLTPCFCRQRVGFHRTSVPFTTLGRIVDSGFDLWRQR